MVTLAQRREPASARAVRDALIAFMAATAQAQAEASKEAQREGIAHLPAHQLGRLAEEMIREVWRLLERKGLGSRRGLPRKRSPLVSKRPGQCLTSRIFSHSHRRVAIVSAV
jgi:hypothetical protein